MPIAPRPRILRKLGALEPKFRLDTEVQNPIEPRGGQVMPASKRRYGYDDGLAAKMHSLKIMFEAPQPNKKKEECCFRF